MVAVGCWRDNQDGQHVDDERSSEDILTRFVPRHDTERPDRRLLYSAQRRSARWQPQFPRRRHRQSRGEQERLLHVEYICCMLYLHAFGSTSQTMCNTTSHRVITIGSKWLTAGEFPIQYAPSPPPPASRTCYLTAPLIISRGLNHYHNTHTQVGFILYLQVRLVLNNGKDFSGDTAEIIGHAAPTTFVAFNAIQYQLYSRGVNEFFRKYDVRMAYAVLP